MPGTLLSLLEPSFTHRNPLTGGPSRVSCQRAAIYRAFDKQGVLAEQDFPTRPTSRGLSPWH
ncbi:hypothetical protein EZZ81_16460 [Pseudomonas viridiflava]|uniref:Uncharacterized protein n=1 Tax=Pseudomonas viridiflava TaxID=33069 RepID=A0AA46VZM2_PSEVI|nr:hypothetical protein EZZ81_16460 [Pseudomonas viridiflava]